MRLICHSSKPSDGDIGLKVLSHCSREEKLTNTPVFFLSHVALLLFLVLLSCHTLIYAFTSTPNPHASVVEMLKSLHSLQQENQRLQDQILSLTAKKERLQLLNVELAVPFPPQAPAANSSVLTTNQINFLSSPHGQPYRSNVFCFSKIIAGATTI